MRELNVCPVNIFDDVFLATKESQGFDKAVLAIKYVLFDDISVFGGAKPVDNKYLYISSRNGARKKAMILQRDDLAHILIKYCLASFGLRNKPFSITSEDFNNYQSNIKELNVTAYEMIEIVSYACIGNVYLAYELLFENIHILSDVVEYMIQERFISNLKEALDSFNGVIENNDIIKEERFNFYECYVTIDKSFAEIKRNNVEYIK